MSISHSHVMSSNTVPEPDDRDREMLPDERAVIAERLDMLDDNSHRVSAVDVAQNLGFDHLLDETADKDE